MNKFEQGGREQFYKSIQNNYNRWFTTYASSGSDNPHMFAVIKTFESAAKYYRFNINDFYIYCEVAIFQLMDRDTTLRLLPLYIATIVKTPNSSQYYDVINSDFNQIVTSKPMNSNEFKLFIESIKIIKNSNQVDLEYLNWYSLLDDGARSKINMAVVK